MPLRFDLSNEACPASNMLPATIATHAGRYLTTIAGRFEAQFGSNWLISCPESPRSERAALMVKLLLDAGLSPRFIEIHTYRTDPSWVFGALDGANSLAQRLDATLILARCATTARRKTRSSETGSEPAPNHAWPKCTNGRYTTPRRGAAWILDRRSPPKWWSRPI